MTFQESHRRPFIAGLYFIILFLLIANLFVIHSEYILHQQYSFAWQFYFDRRLNFPFFYSLLLSLTNLFLLFRIVRTSRLLSTQTIFWTTLLITFFLFTIDEAFYIHQHFKMSTFGRIASYDRSSWSHYLWVIPYFIVFGMLFVILFKYASAIENSVRKKLLIAGAVFLFGAVGMEAAGTYYAVLHPQGDIYLLLIKSAEGVFQMTGAVMFVDVFFKMNTISR